MYIKAKDYSSEAFTKSLNMIGDNTFEYVYNKSNSIYGYNSNNSGGDAISYSGFLFDDPSINHNNVYDIIDKIEIGFVGNSSFILIKSWLLKAINICFRRKILNLNGKFFLPFDWNIFCNDPIYVLFDDVYIKIKTNKMVNMKIVFDMIIYDCEKRNHFVKNGILSRIDQFQYIDSFVHKKICNKYLPFKNLIYTIFLNSGENNSKYINSISLLSDDYPLISISGALIRLNMLSLGIPQSSCFSIYSFEQSFNRYGCGIDLSIIETPILQINLQDEFNKDIVEIAIRSIGTITYGPIPQEKIDILHSYPSYHIVFDYCVNSVKEEEIIDEIELFVEI